jgi:hypothetical protein
MIIVLSRRGMFPFLLDHETPTLPRRIVRRL